MEGKEASTEAQYTKLVYKNVDRIDTGALCRPEEPIEALAAGAAARLSSHFIGVL